MSVLFANARHFLSRLTRLRSAVVFLVDGLSVASACLTAFLLRFEFSVPPAFIPVLEASLAIWPLLKLLTFGALRVHRSSWRYFSVPDLFRLTLANALATATAAIVMFAFGLQVPRSIWVIDIFLCLFATSAPRMAARVLLEIVRAQSNNPGSRRTIIYGAGDAGIALIREIRQNPALNYDVRGFVDDSPQRRGLTLQGLKVLGSGESLPDIAVKYAIDLVLIAAPSATGPEMTRILEHCHAAGVAFKTIPGLGEIIQGNALTSQIRDVAVEDLLGRTPARLDHAEISDKLSGNTILVTGAAGSIGSELCRQIARFNPAAIVGFDAAETALFHIDREMRADFPMVPFHPEIGSIQNRHRLGDIFDQYRPAIVFHAAAYKHVPMMESHVFEAVENNVFGTWNVALAADRHGVQDFVMISSDKAVRPTNVMGATKRVAELLIYGLQNGGANYVSVRFGNVLGSNGSVIPIFKQQIAAGGPVTVTHPEMRRYFMTIPEAAQLVLQASTMGHGGEIFVLDMGDPVKIVDLARNLILLSGLRPEHDIKIEFTGMRPGEKLYEELNLSDETTLPTHHEKIKIFAGQGLTAGHIDSYLQALRTACEARDFSTLLLTLKEIVPDYNPSHQILQRALAHR